VKALVTGATGFLGSYIVDACLARGDRVRVLARPSSGLTYLRTLPGVEIVSGDLTSPASLLLATRGVDVVYHSAARVSDQGTRAQFHDANVAGTRHLLEASRRAGVRRFVFVSSPSVVMDGRDQVDIDESYPYPKRFLNLYSETKAIAEQLVLGANGPDFVTCAIRPRAVWGPRDRTGWLPRLGARLLARRLPDVSGGRPVLASLCYCENAADACALAARSDAVGGRAYFVTDRERTDVWRFASTLVEMFRLPPIRRKVPAGLLRALARAVDLVWTLPVLARTCPPPLSAYAVALLTRSATYDIGAAARDFGYQPRVDQATGLAHLKEWVDAVGGMRALARP
jgi:nucleoside-diphosphate-sugar epimerase